MKRVFTNENGDRRTVETPYESTLVTDREQQDFSTHSEAVAAHVALIRQWFVEGFREIPPSRVLAHPESGERLSIRPPTFEPELFTVHSVDGENTETFDTLADALKGCLELLKEKLADGFVDVQPDWDAVFPKPPPSFELRDEVRDEDQSRRYYVDDNGVELGAELVDWTSGSFDAMLQVETKVHGWQYRYVSGGSLRFLNPYLADSLFGPVILFDEAEETIHVTWKDGDRILSLVKIVGDYVDCQADGHDEDGERHGEWRWEDAENTTVHTYDHGRLTNLVFYRPDGTLEQSSEIDPDGVKAVEIFWEDGTSLKNRGTFDAEGNRLSWETFKHPNHPEDEVVDNGDGTVTTTIFYVDGTPEFIETKDADGKLVGTKTEFYASGNTYKTVDYDVARDDAVTEIVWQVSRHRDGVTEHSEIVLPWISPEDDAYVERSTAFHDELRSKTDDGWILSPPPRLLHRDGEKRTIWFPINPALVWSVDGEEARETYDTIDEAIVAFNRRVVAWFCEGFTDVPTTEHGGIPAPPAPYFPMIYAADGDGPDDIVCRNTWVRDAFTDNESRHGYGRYVWGDDMARTMFFYEDKELGHRLDYDSEGHLILLTTWVDGVKHGPQLSFFRDGGIKMVRMFDHDECVSESEVDRWTQKPSSYRDEVPRDLETINESSDEFFEFPFEYIPDDETVTISDNEGLRDAANSATKNRSVKIANVSFDGESWDRMVAMANAPFFKNVNSLTFWNLMDVHAIDMARFLNSGLVDHIEHLAIDAVQFFMQSDGADDAVLRAALNRPALRVLRLSSLRFSDPDNHSGDSLSDEAFARAIYNSESPVEHLSLTSLYHVGEKTVQALPNLKSLKSLKVASVSIGDEGFSQLPALGLENVHYSGSQCGSSIGLDNALHVAVVKEAIEKLRETTSTLYIYVEAETAGAEAGDLDELIQEPSNESFRRLIVTLQEMVENDDDWKTSLARVREAIADWAPEVRAPAAYFINDVVAGTIPTEFLSIVGSLRLFDLALDPATHKPASYGTVEPLIEKLETMLRAETDARVSILDLSSQAWLSKVRTSMADVEDASFPIPASFWEALATSDLFSEIAVLDISQGDIHFDPARHDDYNMRVGLMSGYDYELNLGELLANARFSNTLRVLRCQDLDPAYIDSDNVVLPALTTLDFSGSARRVALAFMTKASLPSLRRVELRGNAMDEYAVERPFDEIDEEDQTWLAHDWGVYSQDDLDAYPLSQTYVSELLSISETIEVMVGPEFSALADDDRIVPADRQPVTIPW